ncbi:MAG TPA: ferritin-like domain-containing protein [Pyrinomonadaceae bacterium]|nr:ferritin-like domain-containing protein [Pyrinomonadaceae bacterium]
MVSQNDSSEKLIALLQLAYSGELAAAHAYQGHWHSVSDAAEKASIQSIENDEWRHRKLVGEMLAGLNAGPSKQREVRATIIWSDVGIFMSRHGLARADVRRRQIGEPQHSRVRNRCAPCTRLWPHGLDRLLIGNGGSRVGA